MQESQSETSSVPDMSTDTNSLDSDSDKESSVSSKKREGDHLSGTVGLIIYESSVRQGRRTGPVRRS